MNDGDRLMGKIWRGFPPLMVVVIFGGLLWHFVPPSTPLYGCVFGVAATLAWQAGRAVFVAWLDDA